MRLFVQEAVLLLGIGFLSAPAKARKVVIEDDAPNSIALVSRGKAGDETVRIMNETQSPRFHGLRAPCFVSTDHRGRFALDIGGYVKATVEYDFGGISNGVGLYPFMIPNDGQSYVRSQFQVDTTTSTIFLKLVGRTKHLEDFVVYTVGDFRGDSRVFELQSAYVPLLSFTMGYGYSTLMDLAVLPPSIGYAGPAGQVFSRVALLRYERAFGKGWKAGAGTGMPVVNGIMN